MAAKTVLVIWTLAQELLSPSTRALTASAEHALGGDVVVEVQALPEGGAMPRVDASLPTVRLTWLGENRESARVACFVPRLGRWVEREVTFQPDDPETERGRTLGFVVASMLLDQAALRNPRTEAPLERQPEPEPTPVVELPPAPTRAPVVQPVDSAPAIRLPPVRASEVAAMAIAAAASAAGPGDATGFGAWLGADWALGSGFWLGLSAEGRLGSIPAAQATSVVLNVGAGLLWAFWKPSDSTWVGARASTSAARIAVTHLSGEESSETEKTRVLPSFELSLLGGYQLTSGSALYAELGSHLFPGTTEIFVSGVREARLPYIVPLGRLGVRTSF